MPQTDSEIADLLGTMDIYVVDQLQRGRLRKDMRVLDAGCGSGRNLTYLLQAGAEVYGVDRNESAIERAREQAQRLAPDLTADHFQVADLEALPFEGQSFDAVLCSAVLHFAPDERSFLRQLDELWRVLRPGGVLFVRLASSIGIEDRIESRGGRRFGLPDGTERFLVDEALLLERTEAFGATLLDPLKTTHVQGLRCMTTWVLARPR
jgi:tellurite methyltransferase